MSAEVAFATPAQRARRALGLVDRPRVIPEMSLTEYKRRFYPGYIHAPHLDLLDRHLEQVARYVETGGEEGIPFLVVEVPPRCGKTVTLRNFVSWFQGRNPGSPVIMVSNIKNLADDNSLAIRSLIQTQEWQDTWQLRLADDRALIEDWKLAGYLEGGLRSVSTGTTITGRGAELLILDDLVAGRLEVESGRLRDKLYTKFIADIMQRQQPRFAAVLNATRWHEDDPIGRVLKRWDESEYVRLRMQAIATEEVPDPLGRAPGEALWPEIWPLERLERRRAQIGEYEFQSQFQQNPTPPEGGLWKRGWIENDHAPPRRLLRRVVVGVDPAGSSRDHASMTGIVVCGMDDERRAWVLEDATMRGTPDEWARAVLAAVERWRADCIVAEVNFGGEMVAHTIRTLNRNVLINQVRAARGKRLRAEPVMARYQQGEVLHNGVLAELERQMMVWTPGDDSPDRLDAMVWALTDIFGIDRPTATHTHYENAWEAPGGRRVPW